MSRRQPPLTARIVSLLSDHRERTAAEIAESIGSGTSHVIRAINRELDLYVRHVRNHRGQWTTLYRLKHLHEHHGATAGSK